MDEEKGGLPQSDDVEQHSISDTTSVSDAASENVAPQNQQSPEDDHVEHRPPENVHTFVVWLKKFWWIVVIGVLVIAAVIAYFVYVNHRKVEYNLYLQAAEDAMNNGNYKLAISDYNMALSYNNTPEVQAQLSNATQLEKQHMSYLAGMTAMNSSQYQMAISDFQSVTNGDRADYSQAQSEISLAESAINKASNQQVVSTLLTDSQKISSDIAALNSDVNQVANLENNITDNDAFGSQALTNDIATLSTDAASMANDVSTLQSDSGKFNTDGQYITESAISTIVSTVNSALSAMENDFSGMSNIASTDLASIQNQEANGGDGYNTTPIINADNTSQWNSDLSDSTDEFNQMTNALSQLKAYSPNPSTGSNGQE